MKWSWVLLLWSLSAAAAELRLEAGQTRLVDRTDVSEILLGNGTVATVRPVNESTALVVGITPGVTEMYFIDRAGGVKNATLTVVSPGTLLGPLLLRLVVVEESSSASSADAFSGQISARANIDRDGADGAFEGLLNWLPQSQSGAVRVVAKPRIQIEPGHAASLNVGGEIERAGAEGATEDKAYGLELNAEFVWVDHLTVKLSHAIELRTPVGEGEFRRQTLEQTLTLGVSQVAELARFDGIESGRTMTRRGVPVGGESQERADVSWRVLGWLEPVEAH